MHCPEGRRDALQQFAESFASPEVSEWSDEKERTRKKQKDAKREATPVVRLPDGREKRLPSGGFPAGTSEARAREHALVLQKKADTLQLPEPDAVVTARAERRAAERWTEAWFADREARGLTTVRENRSHWEFHISPILGDKHPKDWTKRGHAGALNGAR